MLRISELTEGIATLQRRIWTIEKAVCGPGAERDRLRRELAELHERKRELVAERDRLIKQRNAEAVALEFGTPAPISNETRSAAEIAADIEKANAAKKARAAEQLRSFGDLLKPRVFTH